MFLPLKKCMKYIPWPTRLCDWPYAGLFRTISSTDRFKDYVILRDIVLSVATFGEFLGWHSKAQCMQCIPVSCINLTGSWT